MAKTGRQLAIQMARRFRGTDWVAELAKRAGQKRDIVERHLMENAALPAEIAHAVDEMLSDAGGDHPLTKAKPSDFAT